jgi:cell wall-associated NlpC family hydrolase
MAVQRAEFGRDLDYGMVEIGAAEGAAVARHIGAWRRVDVARPGDAVLMRRGPGWHVGVALDDTRMLHAEAPASAIDTFRARKWGKRLDGIYRFVDHG